MSLLIAKIDLSKIRNHNDCSIKDFYHFDSACTLKKCYLLLLLNVNKDIRLENRNNLYK